MAALSGPLRVRRGGSTHGATWVRLTASTTRLHGTSLRSTATASITGLTLSTVAGQASTALATPLRVTAPRASGSWVATVRLAGELSTTSSRRTPATASCLGRASLARLALRRTTLILLSAASRQTALRCGPATCSLRVLTGTLRLRRIGTVLRTLTCMPTSRARLLS